MTTRIADLRQARVPRRTRGDGQGEGGEQRHDLESEKLVLHDQRVDDTGGTPFDTGRGWGVPKSSSARVPCAGWDQDTNRHFFRHVEKGAGLGTITSIVV